MGSITLIVEEACEFERDDREFDPKYFQRTKDFRQAGKVYILDGNYCYLCGKHRMAAVHKGPITQTIEVPDCVEEMYEKAQQADSHEFDVAEETKKRGWHALAHLSHVSDPDRQGRACFSSEDELMQSDVNWSTAQEWFRAVEDGKWCTYTAGNLWFGTTDIILFDPTHAPTAEVAERIDNMLGPDSGNVVLDDDALEEAKHDQLDEYLTSGHLRSGVPVTVDTREVGRLLRQLDGEDYWDTNDQVTEAMVAKVVREMPHRFDEGFEQESGEDDAPYLCVCGLKETAEIHREEIPGQQRIEIEEG